MDKATKAGIKGDLSEKAAHKLAWSYYQQGQFDKAGQSFDYQVNTFGGGELAADGLFMAAESLFKQNKYELAYAAYQKALAKLPANKDFQVLIYLHAGQSAAQLKKWDEALKLFEQSSKQFADSPYLPSLMYERAWALQNLGKTDEAFKLYDEVTAASEGEVGARARFMMGEIQFEKKEYKEAVRSFFKVAYGYGYPNSPEPVKKWQANSAYEAARCFETLAGQDAGKKAAMLEQAKKSYQEVLEKYPTSDKAGLSKSRLEALGS
jgi:TolA-binding protein